MATANQPKPNIQVILPDLPADASPAMRDWWRSVRFAFDQMLPNLIVNSNRLMDGRLNVLLLDILYAAPLNIANGMIVYADGTSWNPGAGAGTYERKGGAWSKL